MDGIDASGKALVDHWNWAAEKGLMNRNTANALRAACSQVLGVSDGWQTLDVRKVDVAETSKRFQNKRSKDFTPGSLETYKRRFAHAVNLFLEYVNNPSTWKAQDRASRKERKVESAGAGSTSTQDSSPPRANELVDYPFPLREGRIAYVRLPPDLKVSEVKRLSAFLSTLAVDFEPQQSG